ncbi:MAG: TrmB family transcriptional regulator [Candidatus Hodarchaeota archaeon]
MFLSEDLVKSLTTLGFTTYCAKVYSALVLYGTATAAQIAETAEIPPNKVYTTLKKLEKEGFVETESINSLSKNYAKRFRARNPEDVLGKLNLKYKGALDTAKNHLERVQEHRGRDYADGMWILRGDSIVFGKITEMVEKAEEEVILVTDTLYDLKAYPQLAEKLKELALNGPKVRILTSVEGVNDEGEKEVLDDLNGVCEIKIYQEPFNAFYVIIDRKHLLFGSYVKRGKVLNLSAIWYDNESLSKLWSEFTKALFKNSKKSF